MAKTIQASAEIFQEVIPGELLKEQHAESADDILVQILSRRRRQENIVIPAVPEPLIVWIISGEATVEERALGGTWKGNRVVEGDFFLTTATAPTEMRWTATGEQSFQVMHVYIGLQLLMKTVRDVHGRTVRSFSLREVSGETDHVLSSLLEHIKLELNGRDRPSDIFIQGLGKAITVHLVRSFESAAGIAQGPRGGLQAYKLHKILDAMTQCLAEPFLLSRYSSIAELSDYHFSRVFKQSTGLSPSSYFINLRMEHAKQLLQDGAPSIIDVCASVGYASASHFSTLFKAANGMTPSEYREFYEVSRRR